MAIRNSVLVAATAALMAVGGATTLAAAPLSVAPVTALEQPSGVAQVRYRRSYDPGAAIAGTALGLFALGAAGAYADDTYDDGYDDGYYGSGYDEYPSYGRRVYRHPYPQGRLGHNRVGNH